MIKLGPVIVEKKKDESIVVFFLEAAIAFMGVKVIYKCVSRFRKSSDPQKNLANKESQQDPENLASQKDKEVKNHISKELGLYDKCELHPEELVSQAEVDENGVKPIPLIGKLIKLGDRVVIASPPGEGKSCLVTQMGICITEGRIPEFFPADSTDTTQQQVVHLFDGELDKDDRMERYGMRTYSSLFKLYSSCKFRTIYYLLENVWKIVKDTSAHQTFVFDNLFALMPNIGTEDTRTFFHGLDIIQQRVAEKGYRITIIIVTHTTKRTHEIPTLSDVAGSAHVTRFAKNQLVLVKLQDENTYALVTNKKRYSEDKTTYLMSLSTEGYLHFEHKAMVSNGYVDTLLKSNGSKDDTTYKKYLEALRLHEEENLSWDDVAKKIEVSRQTINNWRKKYDSE